MAASRSRPALSGWLAADLAARDVLVVAGAAVAVVGLALSCRSSCATPAAHVELEQRESTPRRDEQPPSLREAFADATLATRPLRACSQAGLVNNLNDALAWGLVPLYLAANGASIGQIGLVAGALPGGLGSRRRS